MLVWFEGDVEKAFADLATDDSEYMMWFRARVLDVTGVDVVGQALQFGDLAVADPLGADLSAELLKALRRVLAHSTSQSWP